MAKAKLKYSTAFFLKDADSVITQAKKDQRALASLGFSPKDLKNLLTARASVARIASDARDARSEHSVSHGHVTALREEGYRLIVHFRDLIHVALRGNDWPDPAVANSVRATVSGSPNVSDVSVESQGDVVLTAIKNKNIAPVLKRRGWKPADTAHLADVVASLRASSRAGIDGSSITAAHQALADAVAYVRTIAHIVFRGNRAKLLPYLVSKNAKKAIAAPTPAPAPTA